MREREVGVEVSGEVSGKALIATARKFLGIIYRTLKERWVFSDFPNFVLAEL